MRTRLALAMILFLTLGACSSSSQCKKACKYVNLCMAEAKGTTGSDAGGDAGSTGSIEPVTCSFSDECSPLEECQAKCMLSASCEVLAGYDPQGADDLAGCIAGCKGTSTKDGTVIYLDGGTQKDSQVQPSDLYVPTDSITEGCAPQCAGKQCGPDSCGSVCGYCSPTESCSVDGQCVATSTGDNSGQICNDTNPSCPDANESCLLMEQGATTGMCLGKCTNPGDTCSVPDPVTMSSICAFGAEGSTDYYCGFLCDVQGQLFSCPNSIDFKCEVVDANQPDIKFCIPK